jgi:hypothetical protein
VATHSHASLARITVAATDSSIYTVIADSSSAGDTGTYELTTTGLPEQNKQLRVSRQRQNQAGTVTINWPSALVGYSLQQNSVLSPNG